MTLVDTFPDDPFQPSLRYAASAKLPIYVPWSLDHPVRLGSSFSALATDDKFRDKSAFAADSLARSTMTLVEEGVGSVSEATTAASASFSDHMRLSIQGQIGGKLLGGSGRAQYETAVMKDANARKSSFTVSYRSGSVKFSVMPRLSREAIRLLEESDDPDTAFRAEFGEYYVGSYVLGASNASMVSGAAQNSTDSKDITGTYEVHALMFSSDGSINEHERNRDFVGAIQLNAYDSLAGDHVSGAGADARSYTVLALASDENRRKGSDLSGRVTRAAEGLGLRPGEEVSWGKCEELFRAHLVVEIGLFPYAKLRDYAAAVLVPRVVP